MPDIDPHSGDFLETFSAEPTVRWSKTRRSVIIPRNCVEISQDNQCEGLELPAAPVASFRSVPAYVLLGDPGSGKSTAFEVEAKAAGDSGELVSARDFITFDVDRHPEWEGKTLFIDGLDEIRVGTDGNRGALDRIRRHLDDLGCPQFRISCREADWLGENDRNSLSVVSPDKHVAVLRLNALTEAEIRVILKAHPDVEDPLGFMNEARRRHVDRLLLNPLTLEMVVRTVSGGEGWPQSRLETFAMFCRQLATEFNEEHQGDQPLPSVDVLMQSSAQLCAYYLIVGAAGYSINYNEADPDYIALDSWDDGNLETRRLSVATRLFASVGGGRFVPAHRHVAEFLGAWHLANLVDDGLPIDRILAMITAGDGDVVTVFRGLSAWLAAHCPTARSTLVDRDPMGVGLYGDLRHFSLGDKHHLLSALNLKVGVYGMDVFGFTPLATSDMEEVLREYLSDSRRDDDHQYVVWFLLSVLSQSPPMMGLSSTLLEIIYDDTCWPEVSQSALGAYVHSVADSHERVGRLRSTLVETVDCQMAYPVPDPIEALPPLLDSQQISPVFDRQLSGPGRGLLEALLPLLDPQEIPPMEVWDHFAGKGIPEAIVEYLELWEDALLKRSTDSEVADLLDRLNELMPDLEAPFRANYVYSAPTRLLVRALQTLGDDQEPARLYDWLSAAAYMVPWDDHRMAHRSSEEVRAWLEQRPTVQKAVLLEGLSRCPDNDDFDLCARQVPPRLHHSEPPADFRSWCLDGAVEWATRHRGVSDYLLRYAVYLGESRSTEPWITREVMMDRTRGHPALEKRLVELLRSHVPSVPPAVAEAAETARAETHYRRSHLIENIRSSLDLLRENQADPALLHEVGLAYFGDRSLAPAHLTSQPGLAGLLTDVDLLSAASVALRGTVLRDDLPGIEEIIRRAQRADPHPLGLPFLAGMDEIERVSRGLVDQLTLMQMRQAVAFYLCIPTNRRTEPEWFLRWASSQPKTLADVLIQCAKVIGNGTMDVCDLDKFLHQEDYSAVAAYACLPLLGEFPVNCEPDQIEWLDQWLWYAVGHSDRRALQTLIEEKLSRQDITVTQRIHWLAAGIVLAPETHNEALESLVYGRDDRIREMASFFAPSNPLGFPGQDINVTTLHSVIRLVGSIVGPEVGDDVDDPDDPELLASAQVEISILMLSRLPGDDAYQALNELVRDDTIVDWRVDLEQAQYRQRIVRRDASYRHPDIWEVRQTLSNQAPSNAGDLASLLTDRIDKLAVRIRTTNTDDWLQYWNENSQGHPVTPKHEEHCRDALLSDLRSLLPDGVTAEPEGEYANDRRSDIRVAFRGFNVPVEVKKDQNRRLWSSLNDQLIARYASDPATDGHGVYLVFWFGGEGMPLSPEGTRPPDPTKLRNQLEALLSPADKRRISVCVVDVSLPKGWQRCAAKPSNGNAG